MKAGKLRHRIDIQERSSADSDSHGDQASGYVTVAPNVAAQVEDISGREFVQGALVAADVSVRVRLRGPRGGGPNVAITPRHRVMFGTRVLDVRHVIDWGGKQIETQLLCTEHLS